MTTKLDKLIGLLQEHRMMTKTQIQACSEALTPEPGVDPDEKFLKTARTKGFLTGNDVAAARSMLEKTSTRMPEIPGYEILKRIGAGGMGVVYKARQRSLDRVVAIKVLSPKYSEDRVFIDRFVREARAAGRLNHPNVIAGYDVGADSGFHYFVMELVEGRALDEIIFEKTRLEERDALDIVLQVARALEHAAEFGIVHRDIKPENIFITDKGVAKLGDLGLAKHVGTDQNVTLAGVIIGTPYYMSPEQARGEENVDARSDIYSLGVTLYHMVTGHVPFRGPSVAVTLAKHLNEDMPPPTMYNPNLSDNIVRLLGKMMAKKREDRYPSAAVLVQDIEAILEGKRIHATVIHKPGQAGVQDGYKFSRVISDDELMFGLIALKSNLITCEQLKECLDMQEKAAEMGIDEKLGNLLVEKGHLNSSEVKAILRTQATHQKELDSKHFGHMVVEAGYATEEQVQSCLEEQAELAQKGQIRVLGAIMVARGFVTPEQKNEILKSQERHRDQKEDLSFGKIAYDLKFVRGRDLNQCMTQLKDAAARGETLKLSDLLVQNGFLTPRERDVILRSQKRMLLTGQRLEDLVVEQRVSASDVAAKTISANQEGTVAISFSDADEWMVEALDECPECKTQLKPGSKKCPTCNRVLM